MGKFKNKELTDFIGKIDSFDIPMTVSQSYDDSQELPMFILDVNDESFYYTSEEQMLGDFNELKNQVPTLSFIEI